MTNKEKFLALVSERDNSVLEQIKWRQDNRAWLKRSQSVAFKILRTLRENKLSQKDLAERLNVSPQQVNKWVRGKENFTFETVAKLEEALNIELMTIPGFETRQGSVIQITEAQYPKPLSISAYEIKKKPSNTKCIAFEYKKNAYNNYKNAI